MPNKSILKNFRWQVCGELAGMARPHLEMDPGITNPRDRAGRIANPA